MISNYPARSKKKTIERNLLTSSRSSPLSTKRKAAHQILQSIPFVILKLSCGTNSILQLLSGVYFLLANTFYFEFTLQEFRVTVSTLIGESHAWGLYSIQKVQDIAFYKSIQTLSQFVLKHQILKIK